MHDFNQQHIGSNFEDFLQEEGILEETTAIAIKRVLSWQIAQAMKEQNLTKTAMVNKIPHKKTQQICWVIDLQTQHICCIIILFNHREGL